jgi:hypothetical protein
VPPDSRIPEPAAGLQTESYRAGNQLLIKTIDGKQASRLRLYFFSD